MTDNPAERPSPPMPPLKRRDLLVGIGFSAVNAGAHLVWNPIVDYWQYVVTTLVFVSALTFWLIKEWRRLDLFITKFYCGAVIVDVFAEGLLQHVHHCAVDNLMCTGRMFLVFFAAWLLVYPLERWFQARKTVIGPDGGV
jgi:hypothetical protein